MLTPGPAKKVTKMIRVHFGEDDRWRDRPLSEAILAEARRQDLAGATVYRGVEGYGASSRIHRKHLLTSSDAMSDVEVIRYTHRDAPVPDA
jgi:PII-like signaling protein